MAQHRWLAVIFLHLTAAFVGPSSSRCCWIPDPPSLSRFHATASDASDDTDGLDAALRRLNLTPEQATVVHERVKKVKKGDGNVEITLSWLEARLDLSVERLGALVVGYPPVLRLGLETNIKPTVAFFDDALSGDGLAAFLCESPSLIEYNVAKRLVPRLARVRTALEVTSVDEETLRAIATQTDSRFEEWLNNERRESGNSDGGDLKSVNGGYSDSAGYDDLVDIEHAPRRHDGPSAYVVVSNLQSGGNIGNIVRSASIFGCEECLVVGQKRYRLTGDHGARFDLPRRHMWSHTDARDYLHEKGVRIYGIEIMADAAPIMRYDRETGVVRFPFDRQWQGAAFIFGNEGQGLSAKQREICDEFLFIPQTRGGTKDGGGSASMNVACAATVILQAYCMWAGYSDASREGEKFLATSGETQRFQN
jgi:tRNA G18 (ribose-2'-O)-methylase SpoU